MKITSKECKKERKSRKWLLMKSVLGVGTLLQFIAMLLNKPYPVEFFTFIGTVTTMYFGANTGCKFRKTISQKEEV